MYVNVHINLFIIDVPRPQLMLIPMQIILKI